jgi:hypothetical protein
MTASFSSWDCTGKSPVCIPSGLFGTSVRPLQSPKHYEGQDRIVERLTLRPNLASRNRTTMRAKQVRLQFQRKGCLQVQIVPFYDSQNNLGTMNAVCIMRKVRTSQTKCKDCEYQLAVCYKTRHLKHPVRFNPRWSVWNENMSRENGQF